VTGVATQAAAINNEGDIVGFYQEEVSGELTAFQLQRVNLTPSDVPHTPQTGMALS
jgi:hypothetical protein